MDRRRGIQDEDTLLILCLYYAYEKSLIDVTNYALTAYSINISDVGFMKRFKRCGEWIKWINQHMMQEKSAIYEIPEKLKDKNAIAIKCLKYHKQGCCSAKPEASLCGKFIFEDYRTI